MSVVWRASRLVVVAAVATLAIGCGGSVADADAPRPTRTAPVVQSVFCQAVQANNEALRPLYALPPRGTIKPDDLRHTADAVRRSGADLVSVSPAEIRKDMQRFTETTNLQIDALVAAGGSTAAVNPDVAARINTPEVLSVNQRVSAYVTKACGRTPNTTR
jgi:hypothetical protein